VCCARAATRENQSAGAVKCAAAKCLLPRRHRALRTGEYDVGICSGNHLKNCRRRVTVRPRTSKAPAAATALRLKIDADRPGAPLKQSQVLVILQKAAHTASCALPETRNTCCIAKKQWRARRRSRGRRPFGRPLVRSGAFRSHERARAARAPDGAHPRRRGALIVARVSEERCACCMRESALFRRAQLQIRSWSV
jgi:hypothetical protein